MNCRICHSENLVKILDMGILPLANALEPPEAKQYPLIVYRCVMCDLIQLENLVPQEEMFSNYFYATGASEPMKRHFDDYAAQITRDFGLTYKDSVLDIGSNDATLLKAFQRREIKVTGIDPAKNIDTKDIPTIREFFNETMAAELGKFSIVTANNVLSHVPNLHDFIRGVSLCLNEKGAFVFEVPWIMDILKKTSFDLFYHEHLTYFGFRSLSRLLGKYDLGLVNLTQFPDIHGGSLRGVAIKEVRPRHMPLFDIEDGIPILAQDFAANTKKIASGLLRLLKFLKGQGWKIAGYGAPAKATILLNYCQIGAEILDYARDTTPMKQGKHIPNTGIPIVSPDYAFTHQPDYYLLFAWNYEREILDKEKSFKGRFIIPFPEPHFS